MLFVQQQEVVFIAEFIEVMLEYLCSFGEAFCSSPFTKDAPVCPLLKEVKEALKCL